MPRMQRSMAVIEVSDVERSAAFWSRALGFTPGAFYGDPPAFCIVAGDTGAVALDRSRASGRRPQNQYWAVYVYVDDVDAMASELASRGTPVLRGPEDQPYGCREIDVKDPDGHIVCFGQDLDPSGAAPGL